MSETISRRHLFNREFRPLRVAVNTAISQADPVRLLALGAPGDEYDAEVGAILSRLESAVTQNDVRSIVRDEFARRFGEDVAGPLERYDEVAAVIWRAVRNRGGP